MLAINFDGLENDINRENARRAYYGVSFSPEKRGDCVVDSYVSHLKSFAEKVADMAAGDERKEEIAQTVFDDLRASYKAKTLKWLSAQGRCTSTMITGGSNYNVRRAERANACEHARSEEWLSFHNAMEEIAKKRFEKVIPSAEKRGNEIESCKCKLQNCEEAQELMKKVNALVRKKDIAGITKLFADKYGEEKGVRLAEDILKPDFAGRVGFASYALTNNLAEIKRLRDRLAGLEKRQEVGNIEQEFYGVKVIQNAEEARLQLIFDGKPAADMITLLKKNAFKWSPRFGAWQRQLTGNAIWSFKHNILPVLKGA